MDILLGCLSLAAIIGFGWMMLLSASKGTEAAMKFAKWFAPVWVIQLLVAFVRYITGGS